MVEGEFSLAGLVWFIISQDGCLGCGFSETEYFRIPPMLNDDYTVLPPAVSPKPIRSVIDIDVC